MPRQSEKNDSSQAESQPWYRDGLRFQCTGCGDCCTGGEGYVWVNQAEIRAMAALIGMADDMETFMSNYTRKIGIRFSLKEYSNGDCYFFDSQTRRCRVYAARPRQCRTWPFWDSNLKSEQAWRETCAACPGSGQGQLYTLGEIEQQRKQIHV